MHILYLHQYFCPPGGHGNTRSLDFAREWVATGHEVTVLSSAAYFPKEMVHNKPHWEIELEQGLKVHVLNVPYSHMMPFKERVVAFLRFYRAAMRYANGLARPDMIYASSTPPTIGELGRRLGRRWGIPYVFETVDVWPDVPEGMGIVRNRWVLKWLYRRLKKIYRDAEKIVTLSEGMRDQVLRTWPVPEKVVVVHNGTNLELFPYQERPTRSPVTCLYAGTVGVANGLEALVDAAVILKGQGRSDIQIKVLGGGNALARVKAYAAQHEIRHFEFLAPVPKEEVQAILEGADIGVVCFAPYAVLEANSANKWYDYLASGLAVVTNYGGWQADYMREWDCGLSAPQGDAEAFAMQIVRLADDAELRKRMGRNGRALAEHAFDRRILAKRVLEIFHQLLQK